MEKLLHASIVILLLFLSAEKTFSQIDVQCNGRDRHSIYLVNGTGFYRIDSVDSNPTDPIFLANNTLNTNSNNYADGISINKNLNTLSGTESLYYMNNVVPYTYWNGTDWVSTGHSSGNYYAVNPGGSSNYIFNFDGTDGSVYRYDGTGNGSLIVSNLGANTNAVYDIAADSLGNFYIFFNAANKIVAFNPDGIRIDSFTTTGFTSLDECGLAILGDRIYASSCYNSPYGLYEGIRTGKTINFTLIKTLPDFFIDIAACPSAGKPLAVFENPELPHFAVYPNPASDVVTLKLNNTSVLEISDCLGVVKKIVDARGVTDYRLDISRWNAGVYFIKTISENKTSARAALIVQ